jgi:hypothetical protein
MSTRRAAPWLRSLALANAVLLGAPPGAQALLDLEVAFSFSAPAPVFEGEFEGIAFGSDPRAEDQPAIFLSQGDECDLSCPIHVYTESSPGVWTSSRSFNTPVGTGNVRGLDVLPNGNLLTSSAESAQVRELSLGVGPIEDDGTYPVGGIAIGFLATFQVESAVYVPGSPESIYVADEEGGPVPVEAGRIYRRDLAGNPLNLPGLGTDNFLFGGVNFDDPGGMAYDPVTDSLYIADDSSGMLNSKVFNYDLSGNLLDESALFSELTADVPGCPLGGCNDSEGLAFATIEGVDHLLVAFENEALVVAFTLPVPEPGSSAAGATALAAVALLARRTRGRSVAAA